MLYSECERFNMTEAKSDSDGDKSVDCINMADKSGGPTNADIIAMLGKINLR
jgi:hypothetical protein